MIIIKDKIYISLDFLGRHVTDLCEMFTYKNPHYYKTQRMGYSTSKIPKVITNYAWTTIDNKKFVVIPRGAKQRLSEFFLKKGIPAIRMVDKRTVIDRSIDFELDFAADPKFTELSTNQLKVVDSLKSEGGLIQAPPGSGKTIAIFGLIAEVKQPTLIVVHTTVLQKQWLAELKEKTKGSYTVGALGNGKKIEGDVTVAIIDSVYSKCCPKDADIDYSYLDQFGMVVFDECLDPESLIATPSGLRKLLSIQVGDEVYTPDGDIARVRNKWVTHKAAYKYYTELGDTIIASSNHIIPQVDREGNLFLSKIGDAAHLIQCLNYGSTAVSKITGFKYVGDKDLIDIELDNEEKLFIADGFVVHNCHHLPAKSFKDIMDNAACRWKSGVTGTVSRKDNMQFLLFDSLGPVRVDIPENECKDRITDFEFRLLDTNVEIHVPSRTFYSAKGKKSNIDFNKFSDLLITSEARNKFIIDTVNEDIRLGYIPMILTNRIEHATLLYNTLSESNKGYIIIGKSNKSVNRAELTDIKADPNFKFLVANTEIGSEGLDLPMLSALHTVMPSSNFPKIKQQLARIRRACANKNILPRLTDYVDNLAFVMDERGEEVSLFVYTARKRLAFYRKLKKEYNS